MPLSQLFIACLVPVVERLLTGGEAVEIKAGLELTKDILGCIVIGDKGYDSNDLRQYLRENKETEVI